MNIRDAILQAADHIEGNPTDFYFSATDVPDNCGTPGCALGWIGFFAGVRRGSPYYTVCDQLGLPVAPVSLEDGDRSFYDRMHSVSEDWVNDPLECARALRLYADKYHPTGCAA
jgi:hypothetical protein